MLPNFLSFFLILGPVAWTSLKLDHLERFTNEIRKKTSAEHQFVKRIQTCQDDVYSVTRNDLQCHFYLNDVRATGLQPFNSLQHFGKFSRALQGQPVADPSWLQTGRWMVVCVSAYCISRTVSGNRCVFCVTLNHTHTQRECRLHGRVTCTVEHQSLCSASVFVISCGHLMCFLLYVQSGAF